MKYQTSFYWWLVEHNACEEGREFVALHGGNFERSFRALFPHIDHDEKCGYIIFLLDTLGWYEEDVDNSIYDKPREAGQFIRREATKRGWIK
jgi:hypothetical protein